MQVDQPGRYKIAAADYHADPCPTPSLSSSLAKIILNESPKHAWSNHPRLNPHMTRRQETFMDIGKVAHGLLLMDGDRIQVIDADDYRSKEARDIRDACYRDGRVPILAKHHTAANLMFTEALAYLREAFGTAVVAKMLKNPEAQTEQTLIWQDKSTHPLVGDTWCRAMVDWIMPDGTIIDYKTTASSVRSDNIERHVFGMDYHIQNAFYERGMDRLFPDGTGRRRFLFLFQEVSPPFACQLIQIAEGSLHIARRMVHEAIDTWSWAMTNDTWPAYPTRPQVVQMPGWQENNWLQHEETSPSGGIPLPDYFSAG